MKHQKQLSRRNVISAAAAAVPILVSSRASASTSGRVKPLSAEEKKNQQTVLMFLKAWGGEPPDPVKLVSFMTDDCIVRVGDRPAAVGKEAALELIRSFLPPAGNHYTIDILESLVRGPMVAMYAIDHDVKNGRTDKGLQVAIVFALKDRKIREWHEYIIGPV